MADFDFKGARAEGYSDAEILNYAAKNGKLGKFDLQGAMKEGYSPSDIVDHFVKADPANTESPVDTAPPPSPPSMLDKAMGYGADLVKSIPSALAKRFAGSLAQFSNVPMADAGMGVVPADLNQPTLSPNQAEGMVDKATGPLYQPKTTFGRIGSDALSAIGDPMSYAGPGGPLRAVGSSVLASALSDTAGEATKGTQYELPARIAAAVLAPTFAKKPGAAPSDAALLSAGGAGSQAVRDLPYATKGSTVDTFVNQQLADFESRNRDLTALGGRTPSGPTTQILNDYAKLPAVTARDYDAMKLRLRDVGDDASRDVVKALDAHIAGLTPADAHLGNPEDLQKAWTEAKGNYAAGKRGEAVEDVISNALDNAKAKNSGLNVGNDIRTGVKPFIKDRNDLARKSGYSDPEIAKMRQIGNGTLGSNLLRYGSNVLGGGGGIGSLVVGGIVGGGGMAAEGPQGSVAGPMAMLAGLGLRKGYNSMQLSRARALSEMVRARAPMSQVTPKASTAIQRLIHAAQALQQMR